MSRRATDSGALSTWFMNAHNRCEDHVSGTGDEAAVVGITRPCDLNHTAARKRLSGMKRAGECERGSVRRSGEASKTLVEFPPQVTSVWWSTKVVGNCCRSLQCEPNIVVCTIPQLCA